jgi:hypothetical protein
MHRVYVGTGADFDSVRHLTMATVAGEQSMQGRVWLLVFGCSLAVAVMHKH